MKPRPYFVECFWSQDGSHQVFYRYTCRRCPLHGELTQVALTAEIDGELHRLIDHAERAQA